jgi:hypothetical protein
MHTSQMLSCQACREHPEKELLGAEPWGDLKLNQGLERILPSVTQPGRNSQKETHVDRFWDVSHILAPAKVGAPFPKMAQLDVRRKVCVEEWCHFYFIYAYFLVALGFELRVYILSHSSSPFL